MTHENHYDETHVADRTILVVGSDASARTAFVALFESEGFRTLQAGGIDSAQDMVASAAVDLVVFDERLSGGRAYAFCRKSAVDGGAPIILLSENADVVSRIVALEVGADDLIPTPVDNRLLLAQARALLRRGGARRTDGVKASTSGFWTVDPVAREAISPKGGRLRISPHEICLLHLFLDNPGVVFTPETAGERIPTLKRDTATGFRTAVSRLRRKLGGLDCGEVIRNVRGAGYMYAAARH